MKFHTVSDTDRHYCVYMHTNRHNNKRYIGMTGQKPECRWKRGRGYDKHPYFGKAVRKYDWNSDFDHEILKDRLTVDEAKSLETYYIRKYDSTDPQKGYNISLGGECPIVGGKEVLQFDKTGKIMKEYPSVRDAARKTGNNHTGILRCCQGERSFAGRFRWMYKKDYLKYGFVQIQEQFVSEEVCVLTLDGKKIHVFPNIGEASKQMGVHRPQISRACRGYLNKTGGFRWMLLSDYKKTKGIIKKYNGKIIQLNEKYEYINEFESPKLAAKELKVPVGAIDYALETKNVCKKTYFVKADEAEKRGFDFESIFLPEKI